ncbi:enoyl-CoA hydratase/isomerase family protein [Caballeronia sp. SEWSISQ10-4 2]|uniref:enoyl-CoA hydratase/isomerase family protein n=1 Tax=Caballeronia sp. SEWSISQ10-4 2 TaxID=2937438 RepID=UPI00264D61BB|nr:enoyl-CoA hydratase/isomerase family protein [Caballeronia sp. SEWSISQ10-4 2]MDN7181088.1 enoyl-CoA hydratase/isomerase family protein [Caballeronia sp. SEWSISQ10-4 2]
MTETIDEIRIERAQGIGFIALNRPKALNALSTPMLHAIHRTLEAWRNDASVHAVVVYSPHPRAFCAGGDIRFLYQSAKTGERAAIDEFFADEYRLNHAIFTYPKPYIALLNGVVMGGGMGISQGARHTGGVRVVTGSTKMAMPETRIGLFPDVGVSWFLARTPGAIGRYLAATGATIDAADALHAGLADAYMDDEALPALVDTLKEKSFASGAEVVRFIEAEARCDVGKSSELERDRAFIDKHFASGNGADCLKSLESVTSCAESEWAAHTAAELRERSPLSVDVSLELVDRAKSSSMAETLRRDLGLTRATFDHGDVMEGIRARIVDKDNQPAWKVTRMEDVTREEVLRMFDSPWTGYDHPLAALAD